MTWSDVAVPGAFVFGVVVGGLGALRVTHYVLDYMRRRDD
jgi:hypothetical protein